MIARSWTARTADRDAAERYRQVFTTEVLEHLRAVPGFGGAYLLARESEESVRVRTLTLFDSLDAVRHFAGDPYDRERVTPAARATLLDSDPVICHFDVLAALSP
jgi:heme-degrading monooxygenase HmoA